MTTIVSHSRYITSWVIGPNIAAAGGGARGRDLSNLKMEQTHPEFGGWRMPAAKLLLFDRSALHCYWILDCARQRRFLCYAITQRAMFAVPQHKLYSSTTIYFYFEHAYHALDNIEGRPIGLNIKNDQIKWMRQIGAFRGPEKTFFMEKQLPLTQ